MALADAAAGFMAGALATAGLLVAFVGWRQSRRALGWTGVGLGVWGGALGLSPSTTLVVPAALALLLALPLSGWLVHRALRAVQRGRTVNAQLAQRLSDHQAQLEQVRGQMQQAQAAAETADQARARFLAAASHDLRQPAHALGLYTAALRAGPLAPGQAEIADRMQASLAAMDTLFAALLDVSRMDAGAVVPQWDTVTLAPLLRRLADEWAPQAEARGLRLALHVGDPGALTVTDPLLLERVLRNLLANAVKYTRSGGVLLACRRRTAPDGVQHLRIEVWDSGVGIAPTEQDRVFEEFFQSAAGQRQGDGPVRTRGLGLGLAIVQRLARLLQLRVVLHSRPGCGSVFFVEGLAPAGVAPQAAAASRREWAPAGRRLAGLLVAVLEDDAEVRDAMRLLLQRWDCRVVDGTQADDLLQRLPTGPDAVLADLRLADGRTGPAELQHLQQAWGRAVPVLWISGETAPDGLRAGLPDGAPVLTKPVSPARLRAWLEQRLPPGGPGERS